MKLLGRLYEPTEGRILLDGCDLRDYDVAELRSETGVIFQDFKLLRDRNVFENVALPLRIAGQDDALHMRGISASS